MKIMKWLLAASVTMGLAVSANAATATWDGENTLYQAWNQSANWVGDVTPTFDNTLDVYFGAAAANKTNYLGSADRTIRSLNYTADATGVIKAMLYSTATGTGGTARNLTFDGGGSGAAITTTAGATATSYAPFGGSGSVILADNLTITHNADAGGLYLWKNFGETGGSRSVTLNGTSTNNVTFATAATYSGGTFLNSGVLAVANNSALGTGELTMNGGTLTGSGAANRTLANNINLASEGTFRGVAGYTMELTGVITNSGGLTKGGGGTLKLSGANTYSGDTTLAYGVLEVNNAQALGTGGNVALNGGDNIYSRLQLDVDFEITGNLTGNARIDLGGHQLTLNKGNYSGSITNDGSLVKTSADTLTLSGTNSTYTGATTVNAGTLVVNGYLLNSDITVNSNATLMGTGTVQGVTLNAGAILAAGNSPGTLTFGGDVLLAAGSTNIMEITDLAYDILMGNGANTLTMDGETVFDFTGFTGGVTNGFTIALSDMFVNWGSVVTTGTTYSAIGLAGDQSLDFTGGNLTVIPEPATIGMLGLGALITMMIRRMRA